MKKVLNTIACLDPLTIFLWLFTIAAVVVIIYGYASGDLGPATK